MTQPLDSDSLDPEDRKLVTLARGARGRAGSASGAAVRDGDGRTYAGADVRIESLSLSALQVAVATALSSGATAFEAAVVSGTDPAGADGDPGRGALAEISPAAYLVIADADGTPLRRLGPE